MGGQEWFAYSCLSVCAHLCQQESSGGLLRTLSRRASLRNRIQQRPPSYPAVTTGRSFNLDELGDSDEENGLTEAPPPMYFDVVESTSE